MQALQEVFASILVGVGEFFHTTVLMPLVADLAPASLRGRYMAAIGLSWWVGLALTPTLGTHLLSFAPAATFIAAAMITGTASVFSLGMERSLPNEVRRTPRPRGSKATKATVESR